jgi:hypothetical protein
MSPDEIIVQLTRVQNRIPREALHAAEEHRAELTPRLLGSLAEVIARPEIVQEDPDWQLPFFAMYLLAAWRETKAHPLLLGFLRLPGDQPVDLSGDIVTQDMNRMLAQTAGGETAGIVALTRDPAVNEWARLAGVRSLTLLTAWGELPRATLIAHYRDLITMAGPPPSLDDPEPLLAEIACCVLDVGLVELREELVVLFDRGWIDESIVGSRDEFLADLDRGHLRPAEPPFTDVAEAIRWWACFENDRRSASVPRPRPQPVPPPVPDLGQGVLPKPHRAPPKVGRNEPCPCGSGKKYKKCCGA